MRWLLGLLKWVCEPFSDSFRIIELLAILIAFVAFFQELGNRQEEREARAWQLLTTKAPGNTGKVWALEYLNREQRWPRRWLWNKKRVPLHGIDLTPPTWLNSGKANRKRRGCFQLAVVSRERICMRLTSPMPSFVQHLSRALTFWSQPPGGHPRGSQFLRS